MARKNKVFHKKFNVVIVILFFVIAFVLFGFCESPDLRGFTTGYDKPKLMKYSYVGFALIVLATVLLHRVLNKTMEGKKSLKKRAIKIVKKRKEVVHTYKLLKVQGVIFFIAAYLLIIPGTFFTFRFSITYPDYYVYTLLGEILGYVAFVIGYFKIGTRANIEFCDLTSNFLKISDHDITFKMPWPTDCEWTHEFDATPFYFLGFKEFEEQTLLAHNLGYDTLAEYNLKESTFTYRSKLSMAERSLQKDRMDRLATGDLSVLEEMPSYYKSNYTFYDIDFDSKYLGKQIEREEPVYDRVAVEDVYHYVDGQLVGISSNYDTVQVGTKKKTYLYCHVKVAIVYKGTMKPVTDLKGHSLKFEGDAYI